MSDPSPAHPRVRAVYERVADRYDRAVGLPERLLFRGGREWAAMHARGRVLEIAAGTGRNLAHYHAEVEVILTDISGSMLVHARRRADALSRPGHVVEADAARLPLPDASVDTVVCTLGLCSVPDARGALSEARRVLRPRGRLVLLEHVRSPVTAVRAVQRVLEPLFLRVGEDHLLRDPLDHLDDLGFAVEVLERSKLGLVERLLAVRAR